MTLAEYRKAIPASFKEKMKELVVYFEKGKSDISLRKQLLQEKIQTIETDDHIDPHFMQHLEVNKKGEGEGWKFASVDNEIGNLLDAENANEDDMKVKDLFNKILGNTEEEKDKKAKDAKDADPMAAMGGTDIEISKLKNAKSPAYFKVDEQMKRFAKMTQSMGQAGAEAFPVKKTLVINPGNALIQNALKIHEKGNNEEYTSRVFILLWNYTEVEDFSQFNLKLIK